MIDYIAYIAGTLTTLAFLPQIRQVLVTGQTHGLSLGMYVIYSIGMGLWVLYGWHQDLYTIVIPNSVTFVLSSMILYRIIRSRG